MRKIPCKDLKKMQKHGDVRIIRFMDTKDAKKVAQTGCPHCDENIRLAKKLGVKKVIYDMENFDIIGVPLDGIDKKKLAKLRKVL